jgi:hypothetical protein
VITHGVLQREEASAEKPVIPSGVRRVLVLGCPGGGKTTFSRELARRSGLPLHHLDDYYWGAGWSRPDEDEWVSRQRALVAQERWIIDGNYLPTVPIRVPKADLIVIIDAPTLTCITRVIRRAWRIRRGRLDDLPAGVRRGAPRTGRRVAATKDFFGLLWKILQFRRSHAAKLLEVTENNPYCLRVLAVAPGLRRGGAMRRRITRSEGKLLIVSVPEALKLVAARAANARTASALREKSGITGSENDR